MWSIATVICTSLGARGVVHSDGYLYKSWSRGVWSIATIICTSLGVGVWSIATVICTSLGVGGCGPWRQLFVQVLESGVWSIATIICTSLGVRGVVHSNGYLYKSWSQGCGP